MLAPSWNKRNRKSAHLVAALRRGRLKECNQTRPLSSFFFFFGGGGVEVELAIYWYLTWKRTLQLQNILEFESSRELDKSVANSWKWNRSLKIVRLGKSVTNHRAYYKQWNRNWNKNTCRCYINFGCQFFFETFAFRSANHRSPIQVSPLPHPHPLQTTSHLYSLE